MSADCSLQVVESQHRSGDLILANDKYPVSERHACRLLGQWRGTQRYITTQRDDEDRLTRAVIEMASQYGRYGYRRVTVLLHRHGTAAFQSRYMIGRILILWRTIFRLRGVHMGCNTPSMLPEPGRPGQRKVFCVKFQREMPGLDEPPFDTELGQRIYENVSEEAWKMWGEHCKMLLNEYRLNPANRQDQEILVKHLEDFFFGTGAALPPGYVPPRSKD
jgi:Fe-S cluster biosynthesis and repair protein YggX